MSNITIMLCFTRSGGTVLNQCLGSLPDVVIMSEVNPLGGGWGKEEENSFTTIKAQAKEWYNIDLDHDEDDFAGCAVELSQKCKHLILRDWSFSNFFPNMGLSVEDEKDVFVPINSFLILDELRAECDFKPFAFVRNGIDAYLSKKGKLYWFAESYLRYVQELLHLGIPIYKYEDFCLSPERILKDICLYAGLPYKDVFTVYSKFTTVNGDVQGESRGNRQNRIISLPRLEVTPRVMADIYNCAELQEANKLLGYEV